MQMLLKPFHSSVIQDQETNGPLECRHDLGCPSTCFTASNLDNSTASAFQVLGLQVHISIPGKHTLIPKKMLDMLDVIFFLTTSTHLQYHLDGDLLKMGYIYHIGVCTVISALLCLFRTSEEIGELYQRKIHPSGRCQQTIPQFYHRPSNQLSHLCQPHPPPTGSQHLHDKRLRTCQVCMVTLTSQQGEKGT